MAAVALPTLTLPAGMIRLLQLWPQMETIHSLWPRPSTTTISFRSLVQPEPEWAPMCGFVFLLDLLDQAYVRSLLVLLKLACAQLLNFVLLYKTTIYPPLNALVVALVITFCLSVSLTSISLSFGLIIINENIIIKLKYSTCACAYNPIYTYLFSYHCVRSS